MPARPEDAAGDLPAEACELSREVVDGHRDVSIAELPLDDRPDFGPRAAGKAASDPGHMNRFAELEGAGCNRPKSACDRIDPNGRLGAAATESVLSDEVCDDESGLDDDELDLAELERLCFPAVCPAAVEAFRFRPPPADG
ncbi:MAG: hypothetical protein IT336_13525 [Thermomicrobiales bacterium]|nr:hypothetical protein [Thermomicrobiales bacterium]